MLGRTPQDWGHLVRERRRDLRISQAQLADILGVTRQWVVNFEKGAPTAQFILALRAAEAVGLEVTLNVSLDEEADVLNRIAPPPGW